MTSTVVTPVPEAAPPLSQGQRIINTFIAPSKTFADLRRSASWWLPFLLMSLASLLFVYVVDQKIGFRKVAENQLQMSPKGALLAMLSVALGASADSFTFQNPVASNPGYFINPAESRWLYSFGTALDLFMIFVLASTGLGAAFS
jgi:hypothetical protein